MRCAPLVIRNMIARISDLSIDISTRKQRLTLELGGDFRRLYDELKDKDLDLTLKPHREKRSLNANAYLWTLIRDLAERMHLPDVEVYRNAIKRVGVYKDFGDLSEKDAKTLQTAWGMLGLGWISEQLDYAEDGEKVTIRCYYGSSVYNTKQMGRLIDDVVSDCRELGVETKPPEEVDRLVSLWKGAKIND